MNYPVFVGHLFLLINGRRVIVVMFQKVKSGELVVRQVKTRVIRLLDTAYGLLFLCSGRNSHRYLLFPL
ncbi:MAG: hypothetical protein BWY95_02773 [Bacteroidetes bacterium ADurb.BinA104]|nr:MAG: hypothetical protein BWY95_02773 [Bacteroidetes bacterium ADurb.BinA104]